MPMTCSLCGHPRTQARPHLSLTCQTTSPGKPLCGISEVLECDKGSGLLLAPSEMLETWLSPGTDVYFLKGVVNTANSVQSVSLLCVRYPRMRKVEWIKSPRQCQSPRVLSRPKGLGLGGQASRHSEAQEHRVPLVECVPWNVVWGMLRCIHKGLGCTCPRRTIWASHKVHTLE